MISAQFEYVAPASLEEAIGLLQQHGDDAKLLAGGHSLLPAIKLRLAQPGLLVDLGRIAALRSINVNGNVRVGAMTTYHAIASSEELRAACGVLAECAEQIGDIQVRNRGTIGGSLAHADPAADLPAVALALNAALTVQGPSGARTIAADDMFVEMLTTALAPDEIITTVEFPSLGAGEGAAYAKLRHPASRYAIVGVAVYVKLAGDTVETVRAAVTGAGPKAARLTALESALTGQQASDEAIKSAASATGDEIEYLSDIHASEEYRRAMVKVYARRALAQAVARARG